MGIACYTVFCLTRMQVFVSTVPLLTDRDLEELGIKTVGDRAVLRKRCRDSERS